MITTKKEAPVLRKKSIEMGQQNIRLRTRGLNPKYTALTAGCTIYQGGRGGERKGLLVINKEFYDNNNNNYDIVTDYLDRWIYYLRINTKQKEKNSTWEVRSNHGKDPRNLLMDREIDRWIYNNTIIKNIIHIHKNNNNYYYYDTNR